MRQVLIQKTDNIVDVSGTKIRFLVDGSLLPKTILIKNRVTIIRIPLDITVVTGGRIDLDFKCSEHLAASGIILAGAYWEDKKVTAMFYNTSQDSIIVDIGEEVLTAQLVEVVSFRQVETSQAPNAIVKVEESVGALKVDKPKSKRRKK